MCASYHREHRKKKMRGFTFRVLGGLPVLIQLQHYAAGNDPEVRGGVVLDYR